MELWMLLTVAAAFMQNVRSALQKRLAHSLGAIGATYCRFLYALPWAVAYPVWLSAGFDLAWPAFEPAFFAFAMLGSVAQIVATALLVHLFSLRNFAIGTTYSKTETVQTALLGYVLLGEAVTAMAALAIGISLIGVALLSIAQGGFGRLRRAARGGTTRREVGIGLLTGCLFAASAVAFRAASLTLDADFLMRGACTLAFAVAFQTASMTAWIVWRDPKLLVRVRAQWRTAASVGVAGVLGSAGWFTAMTLQNAAYVRALGQVELVFAFVASYFVFRERSTFGEVAGVVLVVAGVVLLLLG